VEGTVVFEDALKPRQGDIRVGGQVLKNGSVISPPLWKGRRWRCVAVAPFGPSERSLDDRVSYLKVLAVAENSHAAGLPVFGQLIAGGQLHSLKPWRNFVGSLKYGM
jgi:hypothetical protein